MLVADLLNHFLLLVELLPLFGSSAENSFFKRCFLAIKAVLILQTIGFNILFKSGNLILLFLDFQLLLDTLFISFL